MNHPIVAGERASDRLMKSLDERRFEESKPSKAQVAMVLHALADHTAIMEMLKHRPDDTSPWPEATSIGRWFHDVGDSLEVATCEISKCTNEAEFYEAVWIEGSEHTIHVCQEHKSGE